MSGHYLTLMFYPEWGVSGRMGYVWEVSDLNIAFHEISLIMNEGALRKESLKSTSLVQ